MTHASNKIDWCINKAKKELGEGKKHRGLIQRMPNLEEAKNHIIKAEHNLLGILYFDKGGFSDWSMSAVFYTIYHCFLAIAEKFGYESRNQECTIALIRHLTESGKISFEERFNKAIESYNDTERHESNIIEEREEYTYGTSTDVKNKQLLQDNIKLCKDCLSATRQIVFE